MNRFPASKLPATDKQRKYLKRLTKVDYSEIEINKYDAWEKIQYILKENENQVKRDIRIPSLIEFFNDEMIKLLCKQLGKLSIRLSDENYSNEIIDNEFGVVNFEIISDNKIKMIIDIEDAKDYVEVVIMRKMKKYFLTKYSIGVVFQQNRDYQVSLFKIIQKYYKLYYPDIQTKINIQ